MKKLAIVLLLSSTFAISQASIHNLDSCKCAKCTCVDCSCGKKACDGCECN